MPVLSILVLAASRNEERNGVRVTRGFRVVELLVIQRLAVFVHVACKSAGGPRIRRFLWIRRRLRRPPNSSASPPEAGLMVPQLDRGASRRPFDFSNAKEAP